MSTLHKIQKIFWGLGLDVQRFNKDFNVDSVYTHTLTRLGIDLILDVGANVGQYGVRLRNNYGYRGKIISFEPLDDARIQLENLASRDFNWSVVPWALGDETETSVLNISLNSQSSSILGMEEKHEVSAPDSRYRDTQSIQVKKLDDIYAEIGAEKCNVFLKLDVQGYEMRALNGALGSLSKIKLIQLEMSILPLYESELLIEELIAYMRSVSFQLVSLEPSFSDPITGSLLQVDGLFCRV